MAIEPATSHTEDSYDYDPVFLLHRGGKIAMSPAVPLAGGAGLAMAYTPGVALAALAGGDLAADYVVPGVFDDRVAPAVAVAVAARAREEGVARG